MTDSLFPDGRLDLDRFPEPIRSLLLELLAVRLVTRCGLLGPEHFFLAAVRRLHDRFGTGLLPAVRNGRSFAELANLLLNLYTEEDAPPAVRALDNKSFTPEGIELLSELSAPDDNRDPPRILRLITSHLLPRERRQLQLLVDVDAIERGPSTDNGSTSARPCFLESGQPDPERWTADGIQFLQAALGHAGRTGYEECQLSHLTLTLLESEHPEIQKVLRVHGQGQRLRQTRDILVSQVRQSFRAPTPPLDENSFSRSCRVVFRDLSTWRQPVGPVAIALHLLQNVHVDPLARDALQDGGLRLDIPAAVAALSRALEGLDESTAATAKPVPEPLAELEDLTAGRSEEPAPELIKRSECEELERALCSRGTRCVIVYGESGSGRTKVVECVAARVARGESPSLQGVRFLRLDAGMLEPRACGPAIGGIIRSADARNDLIVVVENFQCLVEHAMPQLALLAGPEVGIRIIGVMTEADYEIFNARDDHLGNVRWNVAVRPVDFDQMLEILRANLNAIEAEYRVRVFNDDLTRIAQAADRFLRSVQRPQRAIQLLRWGCDEVAFEMSQSRSAQVGEVTFDHVAKALARRLNIEEEQIRGERGLQYYLDELQKHVIGQPEAARAVARQILLTRQGARGRDRPAGVLLYAGQTGTGKTLMAEAVARLYSPRGTLHRFSMGDIKSEHETTIFTGSAPSYVGYEQGGALVNALERDPNGVLLFDEAEKAHPAVWDTCLELFSTGRIRDARGRTANASQTLIILTTNLGYQAIEDGIRNNSPYAEIAGDVRRMIEMSVHPRERRPYFRPEFLGRIDEIVVFRPLGLDQLSEIALIEIEKVIRQQREQKSINLVCADNDWGPLARFLSAECRSDPSHGRAVERLLGRLISEPLASAVVPVGGALTVTVNVDKDRVLLFGDDGSQYH